MYIQGHWTSFWPCHWTVEAPEWLHASALKCDFLYHYLLWYIHSYFSTIAENDISLLSWITVGDEKIILILVVTCIGGFYVLWYRCFLKDIILFFFHQNKSLKNTLEKRSCQHFERSKRLIWFIYFDCFEIISWTGKTCLMSFIILQLECCLTFSEQTGCLKSNFRFNADFFYGCLSDHPKITLSQLRPWKKISKPYDAYEIQRDRR